MSKLLTAIRNAVHPEGTMHADTEGLPLKIEQGNGGESGFQAAMDRITTILQADGIKGDARRMSAAVDLANASPGMAGEDVVAFVTANVPATMASAPSAASQASAYEQQRLSAAALAMPRVVPSLAQGSGGGLVANMKRRHDIK